MHYAGSNFQILKNWNEQIVMQYLWVNSKVLNFKDYDATVAEFYPILKNYDNRYWDQGKPFNIL